MLEPCDAKVSRTVPRGLDDRKVVRLLGEQPPRYLVKLLFSFRSVTEVEVPADHIRADG
jgi:hypothetical protein